MIALVVVVVVVVVAATVGVVSGQESQTLRFRPDGKFVIVQFADLQYSTEWTPCSSITPEELPCDGKNTTALQRKILDWVNPDLVVLTGDNLTYNATNTSYYDIISPMIEANIPWAAVHGNHDEDSAPVITKAILSDIERQNRPLSQFRDGPEEIHGVGNYVLKVLSSNSDEPSFHLWMLDSGAYDLTDLDISYYDWIHSDQIAWMLGTLDLDLQPNVPALSFFHIPLSEFTTAERSLDIDCFGEYNEPGGGADINSGYFAAALDAGDVIGMFVGHNHLNSNICNYYGIRLAHGRSSGLTTYGRAGYLRGARVIVLTEGERRFDTYLILSDGTIIEQPTFFD